MNSELINYHNADKIYEEVLEIFKFDKEKDIQARDILYEFRKRFDPETTIEAIQNKILGKKLYFFGAGPNLIEHLKKIHDNIRTNRKNYYLIAADGSARALSLFSLIPDLIFSDLDGLTHSQIEMFLKLNSNIIVHGHGDNIEKLRIFKDLLSTPQESIKIICTTQVESRYPVLNPGGFTDGDRSVFFCHHLAPLKQNFTLFGYDFGGKVGIYSKNKYKQEQTPDPIKKKKLLFCQKLLNQLSILEDRTISFF